VKRETPPREFEKQGTPGTESPVPKPPKNSGSKKSKKKEIWGCWSGKGKKDVTKFWSYCSELFVRGPRGSPKGALCGSGPPGMGGGGKDKHSQKRVHAETWARGGQRGMEGGGTEMKNKEGGRPRPFLVGGPGRGKGKKGAK